MLNIGTVLSLSRDGGGTFQWTINILHALEQFRQDNENVDIFIFHYAQDEEQQKIATQFPKFYFCKISATNALLEKILTRLFIAWPSVLNMIKRFYPLNRISRNINIDLMIFPGASFKPCFYEQKQIFMFTDIAHVFYPHFPEVSAGGEMRRRNLLFKYGIRQATHIIVDSKQLRSDIEKFYSANVSKVEVLYQTISQTLNIKPDTEDVSSDIIDALPGNYIFYPAQLWQHKNHKNLLLALKILVKDYPNLSLVMSGSKQNGYEAVFRLVKELNLQGNVSYLGYVPDKYIPNLYKNAKCLVMPTYFGPTNIPTLEAFYFGCPAVVSNIAGVKEQTGEAAMLFDPDSPKEMADAIRSVLEDSNLRNLLISRGKDRIAELSFDNYKKNFEEILKKSLH